MRRVLLLISLLVGLVSARQPTHQTEEPVARWSFKTSPSGITENLLEPGDQIELIFTATLRKDWLLYVSDVTTEAGIQPATFEFMPDNSVEFINSVEPIAPKRKLDKKRNSHLAYFESKAEFRQRIRILKPDFGARGIIYGQYCSDKQGQCVPFEQIFYFSAE